MTLELEIDQVDFDPAAATLRLKGVNRAESQHVKLGASHTLSLELNRDLSIIKEEWDRFELLLPLLFAMFSLLNPYIFVVVLRLSVCETLRILLQQRMRLRL